MKNLKRITFALSILIALLTVAGCKQDSDDVIQERKALRIELFEKCMRLLPDGPQATKYNDWAEVVGECGTQAYYMSR
ncbi:MAG TPA: hypothetical protein GX732_09385 [Pseudomonas sp.]|nr:hypothetical protein [Pseudomonas sp.]